MFSIIALAKENTKTNSCQSIIVIYDKMETKNTALSEQFHNQIEKKIIKEA